MNIVDKESYLKYRKEWKERYMQLSKEIRKIKNTRKQYIWEYRIKCSNVVKRKKKIGCNPNFIDYNSFTSHLNYYRYLSHFSDLKDEARKMMSNLDSVKRHSKRIVSKRKEEAKQLAYS